MAANPNAGVRRRLGPAQDRVVDRALQQQYNLSKSRSALSGACACLAGSLVLVADLYFLILSRLLYMPSIVLWYSELVGCLLLFLLALVYTLLYVQLLQGTVPVTSPQMALLGLSGLGFGFRSVTQSSSLRSPSSSCGHAPSPVQRTTPLQRPSPLGAITPRHGAQGLPPLPGPSSLHGSPLAGSDAVKSYSSLQTFWRQEEGREERFTRGTPGGASPPTSSPLYTAGAGHTSYVASGGGSCPIGAGLTPPYHHAGADEGFRDYCLATRSPHSSVAVGDKEEESFSDHATIWNKLRIPRETLDLWTENCRKWIAQTVFQPLAEEIKTINRQLSTMGYTQYLVGKAPLHTLRHLTVTEAQLLPTLQMVLPYLEVSSHQDYLSQRILELGSDSCLKHFMWSKGGEWSGRAWNIDLPTDAQIVIHCLCCYLDTNLVPLPLLTDKTFSQLHFLKTPAKPGEKTDQICIYQTSVNPPHFSVVRGGAVLDIPKGFNNLFYAVIVFLCEVQRNNSGMLGSININLSAVNILWIISST